jgi:hypothetical protein
VIGGDSIVNLAARFAKEEMSFDQNWVNHLMASFCGDTFNTRLAQDFWSEELFDPSHMVSRHWLKLFWVFSVSGFFQLIMMSIIIAVPLNLYQTGGATWAWTFILIGATTLCSFAMALMAATGYWLKLKALFRRSGSKS